MDSITHLAVGAVIGHLTAGSVPRKKAMLVGAIAQSLPDIDFVAAIWLNPANNLLAHRGFTHSIAFTALVSFFLALMMNRWNKIPGTAIKFWFFFFMLQMSVHLFIDIMNVYGVGLLEPFSHTRFSLNVLFVADPLFSIWPVVASVVILYIQEKYRIHKWAMVGIGGPIVYLFAALMIKLFVISDSKKEFQKQNIEPSRYMVTPTPLNAMLWYIVAEKDSGYMIGYRSVFDNEPTRFTFFAQNNQLLEPIDEYEDLQHLRRFSQGYYVITKEGEKTVFSDIRFGQLFGWIDPDAEFAFRYYLHQPDTNRFVVQRGRFSSISKANISRTLRRIAGD